jgi:transposase-like protein
VAPNAGVAELLQNLDTEERCRRYLETLRWPDGVRCPRCDAGKGISRIDVRGQFECEACGYQFGVRVGTLLHGSRLPLRTWILAVYLMTESDVGVSTNRIAAELDVSYKTAWYLSHRVRLAMKDEAGELVRTEPHGDGIAQQRLALLRRSVNETHRRSDSKHFPAYLDEAAFRIRNRANEHRFQDVLVRLLRSEAVPYRELTAGSAPPA